MARRPAELLEAYRAKRDFDRTAEPAGADDAAPADAPGGGGRFVVQRHRARRLHYDLRLEVGGVLASWAVPKGPTLDPGARRMAVHVEDHPVEYIDFEGVIPAGTYGGGDVIVWDRGTWRPAEGGDPRAAIDAGELHFDLDGEKLHGRFVLVRRDGRAHRPDWLLIHKGDEHAEPGWDAEDHPRSVKTGRTNDEVAAAPRSRWHGDRPADQAEEVVGGPAPTWPAPTSEELAALDALGRGGTWSLGGRQVALTNLGKVLFPGRHGEAPVTKRDLVRYHAQVAPAMLPYLAGRPVNARRFPDGVERDGFWQRSVPAGTPGWLTRWRNEGADPGEAEEYQVLDSPAALVWMAQQGALELHPWTSRLPDVHQPTWAMVDIDPGPETSFEDVLVLARLHRAALAHLGVEGRPKVTGRRGVQVWVPVAPGCTFDQTRSWVEALSRAVGATVPELVSWEWRTRDRGGRARLDYTQNAVNRTLVAPFSARPAPGAPVSVPLAWDELDDPDLAPDRWTVRTVLDRLATVGDPLAPLVGLPQQLPSLGSP